MVKSLIPVIRRERASEWQLARWHSQALAAGERMDGSGERALSGEARHDPTRLYTSERVVIVIVSTIDSAGTRA